VKQFPVRCGIFLPTLLVALFPGVAASGRPLQQFGVEEIVFAARFPGSPTGDGHWYANIGYYAEDASRKAYGKGGKLYKLNLKTGKLTTLLEDSEGGVRDPQVSYDGSKILFAYRKGGTENYHLYEIDAAGARLKQLTSGPFDDFEPTYLPSGDIVFISTRCKRWVNCWLTQVAILHRCHADGSNIHAISSNSEQDNTPWPLADGRLLYTRWEYVDRSQVDYHHLWAANPDGTGQMIYYGNLHPGTVMIDAKPIPGSRKVVAIFSPKHGKREHEGAIEVVDPRGGPDDQSYAKQISATEEYRDPWAFSEDSFIAAKGATLIAMNGKGETQELFRLPKADIAAKLQLHEPRPLISRLREPDVPARSNPGKSTGRLVLSNVYEGRNMQGVRPGEIKKLLVLESLPMPIHYTGGMEPISFGGTFTLERVVGTVPVEADGSAYIELPALRSFFFVALDEHDMSVKRMQSFTTVQPGETTGCVGCHEDRLLAPPHSFRQPSATLRDPSRVTPVAEVPDVFDFPRDIQPILDRNCLGCHDYNHRAGKVILSGDRGPIYSHSYFTLTIHRQIADGRNQAVSNYLPHALGTSASPLMNKLTPAHHGVQVTPQELKRIKFWIESGAPYAGTYAALGTGMIGGYTEDQLERPDANWPSARAAAEIETRRCGSCHNAKTIPLPASASDDRGLHPWFPSQSSRHLLYNLTRTDQSMLLLAPLSREAGGYGLCKAPIFSSRTDPDYLGLLAYINDAKQYLDQVKRFDMPGFQPRDAWVREMKRFGIPLASPIDYYAAEREYWKSLWYKPQ
jgi:hypothetical protein